MIEQTKRLIGITDELQDVMITDILNITEARLKRKLNTTESIPSEMEYIVIEVSIKRFNRIGAEGMTKKTLEGLTQEFSEDDFKEFESDIAEYLDDDTDGDSSDGVVMFF